MQDEKALWEKVEHLQKELHEIVSKKGMNSPEAVRLIQEFRNKMQEYNNFVKR